MVEGFMITKYSVAVVAAVQAGPGSGVTATVTVTGVTRSEEWEPGLPVHVRTRQSGCRVLRVLPLPTPHDSATTNIELYDSFTILTPYQYLFPDNQSKIPFISVLIVLTVIILLIFTVTVETELR